MKYIIPATTEREFPTLNTPIYRQRASREQVANNKPVDHDNDDGYDSVNADVPENEISGEMALADLKRMKTMTVVTGSDLKADNTRRGRTKSESWEDPNVFESRVTRHRVLVTVHKGMEPTPETAVETAEYRSTQAAFDALSLPGSKAVRFRMRLKQSGKLAFQFGDKTYAFELKAREAVAGSDKGKIRE